MVLLHCISDVTRHSILQLVLITQLMHRFVTSRSSQYHKVFAEYLGSFGSLGQIVTYSIPTGDPEVDALCKVGEASSSTEPTPIENADQHGVFRAQISKLKNSCTYCFAVQGQLNFILAHARCHTVFRFVFVVI
jgi:hypothetical protein